MLGEAADLNGFGAALLVPCCLFWAWGFACKVGNARSMTESLNTNATSIQCCRRHAENVPMPRTRTVLLV